MSIELSIYEKVYLTASSFGDYYVMISCFIEQKNSDNKYQIDYDLVKIALIYLQKRHPLLRAWLDFSLKQEKSYFRLLEQEDKIVDKIEINWLDMTHKQVTRDDLTKECEKFYLKKFEFNKDNLLWRLQFILFNENSNRKYLLNLVMVSIITDGLNLQTLIVEYMNILNSLLTKQECDEMKVRLGNSERLYSLCEKSNFKLNSIQNKIKKVDVKFLFPDKLKQNHETGFKLNFLRLDKKTTENILRLTKENNIRPSAYFHTIAFYALNDLYKENQLVYPDEVVLSIAASLRIRYKPKFDFSPLGLHTVVKVFKTDKNFFGKFENFWSDSKYIHELIKENTNIENLLLPILNGKRLNELYETLKRSENNEELRCILSENLLNTDLGISNLGAFVFNEKKILPGPFDIKEMYCSDLLQSDPAITSAIYIHILYWNNEMMIQFGTNKSRLNSVYSDRFIHLFENNIKNNNQKTL